MHAWMGQIVRVNVTTSSTASRARAVSDMNAMPTSVAARPMRVQKRHQRDVQRRARAVSDTEAIIERGGEASE